MLTQSSSGRRRFKTVVEDERLHGFDADYTFPAKNAKERKQFPDAWLDARGSFLGNCFSPYVLAVMLAELFYYLGWIQQPLDLDELLAGKVRLLPADGRDHLHPERFDPLSCAPEESLCRMIRYLFSRQSARGG